MKKVLLSLSVLSLLFASCSKDATLAESNNSSTNNALFAKSTGIKNIDDLYAQMLKS